MGYQEIAGLYGKHVNAGFIDLLETLGYARLLVRAEGCWVWDDQGRKYLDLVAGFGSMNLGHHHPLLQEALRSALEEKPYNFLHTGPSSAVAELAQALCARMRKPIDHALFSCSGAEAVEGALKIAALATQRHVFVHASDSFHGTSLGTLSIMGKKRMRKPFDGLLSDHVQVAFGSLEELERALKKHKCAGFIVEPVLAEGGVQIPDPHYLDRAQELCHQNGALFIVDEIQTGLGRTGYFVASEVMAQTPDIVVLGKALSGGLMPISATLTSSEIHARAFRKQADFDLHNSTFAGSAMACRVAQKTIEVLDAEGLSQRSATLGVLMKERLKTALKGHPLVRDIRGQGLLIGIEIGPTSEGFLNRLAPGLVSSASQAAVGQWFALKLLEKGVLIQTSSHRWDVLKIEPPLTIQESEIDFALKAIQEVFEEYRSLPKIAWELGRRYTEQSLDSERHL